LLFGFLPNPIAPKVALHLNGCGAGFNIDPSAISDWRFQTHIRKITRFNLKWCRKDELAHVCLYFSFSTLRIATCESLEDVLQTASLIHL
jgi:hypothetical protein